MEQCLFLGDAIMARPVTESKVQQVPVYFPGPDEIWYDLDTFQPYHTNAVVNIPVDINKVLMLTTRYPHTVILIQFISFIAIFKYFLLTVRHIRHLVDYNPMIYFLSSVSN